MGGFCQVPIVSTCRFPAINDSLFYAMERCFICCCTACDATGARYRWTGLRYWQNQFLDDFAGAGSHHGTAPQLLLFQKTVGRNKPHRFAVPEIIHHGPVVVGKAFFEAFVGNAFSLELFFGKTKGGHFGLGERYPRKIAVVRPLFEG